jgi:hypothetical protein
MSSGMIARVTVLTNAESMSMSPQMWSKINLMMPFLADSLPILLGSWSMTFPGGKTTGLVVAFGLRQNMFLMVWVATG